MHAVRELVFVVSLVHSVKYNRKKNEADVEPGARITLFALQLAQAVDECSISCPTLLHNCLCGPSLRTLARKGL